MEEYQNNSYSDRLHDPLNNRTIEPRAKTTIRPWQPLLDSGRMSLLKDGQESMVVNNPGPIQVGGLIRTEPSDESEANEGADNTGSDEGSDTPRRTKKGGKK